MRIFSLASSSANYAGISAATIQAAPVIRKVKANSDQFRWSAG